MAELARAFPPAWSHCVLLTTRSRSPEAFAFYHGEALRGGWSVRQFQRQIDSQFYGRRALSKNKLVAREYLTALPDEIMLAAELDKTRRQIVFPTARGQPARVPSGRPDLETRRQDH